MLSTLSGEAINSAQAQYASQSNQVEADQPLLEKLGSELQKKFVLADETINVMAQLKDRLFGASPEAGNKSTAPPLPNGSAGTLRLGHDLLLTKMLMIDSLAREISARL